MPAFPDLAGPLRSPVAELRVAAERDIPEILIAHQDDPELFLRLGLERPPSGAELGRRSEAEAEMRATGQGVRFTIVAPGSDVCVGQVDVHRVDWGEGIAEAGVWVAPALRGRGIAPAALRLVAGYLFESCGLARLELLTEPGNRALLAAARQAGFVQEGLLRGYLRERGRRVDVIMLSLLPRDLTVNA
ncbi:MAG TPA: GNAT family protein [Solirubrobacteraceae bacterium]|nr:GNAT family protein [Solirubrobacteraceae bacterium]